MVPRNEEENLEVVDIAEDYYQVEETIQYTAHNVYTTNIFSSSTNIYF